MLRVKKKAITFSGSKQISQRNTSGKSRKIGKSLAEFCKGVLSFSFRWKSKILLYPRHKDLFLKELIILLEQLFQQSNSFSTLRLYYPEHLKFPSKNTLHNTFFTVVLNGFFYSGCFCLILSEIKQINLLLFPMKLFFWWLQSE